MPEGPLGLPRITALGPFVEADLMMGGCNPTGRGVQVYESIRASMIDEEDFTDEARDIIENSGLDLLGVGQARVVVTPSPDSPCVIKISKFQEPFQNRSEALSSEKLTLDQKDYFLPILHRAEDFGWVTQAKADSIGVSDEDRRDIIHKIVLDFGIDLTDFNQENFGYLGRDPVVVDYGTGMRDIDSTPEWDSRQDAFEFIIEQEDL